MTNAEVVDRKEMKMSTYDKWIAGQRLEAELAKERRTWRTNGR